MRTIIITKLVLLNDVHEVLLLKRTLSAPNRPGDLDFPGGHVDPGEDFVAAVCRELVEETGLEIPLSDAQLFFGDTRIENNEVSVVRLVYFARSTGSPEITLSDEHDSYFWAAVTEVPTLFPHPVFGASVAYAIEHGLFNSPAEIAMEQVAKAALIHDAGKILLIQRSHDDDKRPGELDFPGGGIESGESPRDAMVREIGEEVGIQVTLDDVSLYYAHTELAHGVSLTRLAFRCRVTHPAVTLSHEHETYQWVPVADASTVFPHKVWTASVDYALYHDLFKSE